MARSKFVEVAVRNAPFWVSAAWAFDFLITNLAAPSQATFDPTEVATAKWLWRWTSAGALERLATRSPSYVAIAVRLDAIAPRLPSASATIAG